MLYAVYLHTGDEDHAHGVTIPDFPGCFSAADRWEELPKVIQEAAEVYFDGEDIEVPAPTPIDVLVQDPGYQGGAWILVDIDVTKLGPSASAPIPAMTTSGPGCESHELQPVVQEEVEQYEMEKVEVSLATKVLEGIDRFAKRHQTSRSAVLARAAEKFLAEETS